MRAVKPWPFKLFNAKTNPRETITMITYIPNKLQYVNDNSFSYFIQSVYVLKLRVSLVWWQYINHGGDILLWVELDTEKSDMFYDDTWSAVQVFKGASPPDKLILP